MRFNTTELANNQYLVSGTDYRGVHAETVVDGHEWNAFKREQAVRDAQGAFDSSLREFFAPLLEATEELKSVGQATLDPLLHVVEQEAVAGSAGKERIVRALDRDTVILRAIDGGHYDRLIWVNGDLEVTAAPIARVNPDKYHHPEDDAPSAETAEVEGDDVF